jgi:hypothetical protein
MATGGVWELRGLRRCGCGCRGAAASSGPAADLAADFVAGELGELALHIKDSSAVVAGFVVSACRTGGRTGFLCWRLRGDGTVGAVVGAASGAER